MIWNTPFSAIPFERPQAFSIPKNPTRFQTYLSCCSGHSHERSQIKDKRVRAPQHQRKYVQTYTLVVSYYSAHFRKKATKMYTCVFCDGIVYHAHDGDVHIDGFVLWRVLCKQS